MSCNELLGDDLNLFWDTASDYDTPSWERQISVGDIGFDPNNEQVEIPKRLAFKFYKKGRGDWELTFTSNFDPDNTFHQAVLDAIENGTRIHLALVAGDDIDTDRYWHGWWFLTGPFDGSLDAPASIDVSGKLHADLGEYCDEFPAAVAAA